MEPVKMLFEDDEIDLEMLSDSFREELARIKEMMDDDSDSEDEEESDEEESDYKEAYGGMNSEMKKYHEKLKKYAENLKENLRQVYADGENENGRKTEKNKENDEMMKSPLERGHKMGCGCPGCSAYREFFGIKIEGKNNLHFRPDTAPDMGLAAKKKDINKYEEKNSRPCGGRMYNLFHGERAQLKNVFGRYTGNFNFGRAGY
jgi:hypothetical protein